MAVISNGRRGGRHARSGLSWGIALALTLTGTALSGVPCVAMAQQASAQQQYDIAAQSLAGALNQLAIQSGVEVMVSPDLARGIQAPEVKGRYDFEAAIDLLLEGSGLIWKRNARGLVTVGKGDAETPAKRPISKPRASSEKIAPVTDMPELLVKGARSLNADIRRTIDDPQPYVVFEREDIEMSGAININDFLMKRVSANTSNVTPTERGLLAGDFSSINLRGLGEGQTLILIDGRRAATGYDGYRPGQPYLSGIPLAAVERIEVLPTTASAIYGGSATGGVINIILRRDYSGGEVALSHDNSADTDSSVHRMDLSYGFNFGEKTTLLLNGSYSEANYLLKRDREFRIRGYERIHQNDPDFLSTRATLSVSTSPNVLSSTGEGLVLLDGTQLNSAITHVPVGYMGPDADNGSALVANAGRLNSSNDNNAYGYNGGSSFGTAPRNKSLSVSFRHGFNDRLDGFLDLSASESDSKQPYASGSVRFFLPAGHAFNPFRQSINVMVPSEELNTMLRQRNENQRASAGLIARIGQGWAGSVDMTWSRSSNFTDRGDAATVDYAAALADGFNPLVDYYNLGGRTFQPYRVSGGQIAGPSWVYAYNPTLRLSGPLWPLPAGPVAVSFLVEQQRLEFADRTMRNNPDSPREILVMFPGRSQDIRSVYAELTIPIVGKSNAMAGMRALDVQLAARYDDYDTLAGNTVNWNPGQTPPEPLMVRNSASETTGLLGMKYAPFDGLTLRFSHGTGFVPPDVTQLQAPQIFDPSGLHTPDPRRGNTVNPIPIVETRGGNPALRPEHSRTTSFGIIVEPVGLPGTRVSLDYTRLRKTDNITTLSRALLLEHEDRFPERIRRGENLPTDQPGWAGPVTHFDTTPINAASGRSDTLDAQLQYGFDLANGGYVELWGSGTWILKADQQSVAGGPSNNLRGISASAGSIPLSFRGFYGVNMEKDNWAAGWTVQHYSSYLVADPELASSAPVLVAQGSNGRVPRQVLHDVWGRWRFTHGSEKNGLRDFLSNLEIRGGVRNIFNTMPEVDLSNAGSYYSYLVSPRLRTYYVQVKYAF